MKLPSGAQIEMVSLWNRDQWHYIRKPCNWFRASSDHACWMLTIFGFHFWLFPPKDWTPKR